MKIASISTDCVERLLAQVGISDAATLTPLQGGANSKAFRVDAADQCFFLKKYHHDPTDGRDRLGTEFAFATFAWDLGLRTVATPFAMDRAEHAGLYDFLTGAKVKPGEITDDLIRQCLCFVSDLNEDRAGATLPDGSEACFCLEDHWNCLIRRVRRLDAIEPTASLDRQALMFAQRDLAPACAAYLGGARELAAVLGLGPDMALSPADRCLSPSDFGFHNALLADDGALRFFDFEYAGWDDPAKLVCDFFCQPACPVPMQYYADFADQIAYGTTKPGIHRMRMDLLLPMYRLKWCCILLNDFLPSGGSRRRYALEGQDESARKAEQLHKARTALNGYWGEQSLAAAA